MVEAKVDTDGFEWVASQVESGEAVLFLGAASSFECQDDSGKKAPRTEELKHLLCEQFLKGKFKGESLAKVAELSKAEQRLLDVQRLVRDHYIGLQPCDYHLVIPRFRWATVVTTNYDLVIERSYERVPAPLQTLIKVTRDGDLHDAQDDLNAVPLIKLHGCVTQHEEPYPPFILASEEYAKFSKGRSAIFSRFSDIAKRKTIIFCGYSLADENISQILWDIGNTSNDRPRYALVDPHLDPIEVRYWRERRVLPLVMSMQDFLLELDRAVPEHNRSLAAAFSADVTPLTKLIGTEKRISEALALYLESELHYIADDYRGAGCSAREFYSGLGDPFSAIQENYDVRRRVTDSIILTSVVEQELDSSARLFVLKGYAGGGKSVILVRAAIEAARDFDAVAFFLSEAGEIDVSAILELARLTGQRLLLFVHDLAQQERGVVELLNRAREEKAEISVIGAARFNEWNIWCGELEKFVTEEFKVTNLSEDEIRDLLEKLNSNQCLGSITDYSRDQQIEFFSLTADRQLLVALHEAMFDGGRFEDIIENEFEQIQPNAARQLYLDICTLNKFEVGVRAGLISRISGISMERFREDFHSPLEHVVRVSNDWRTGDYMFQARHPIIADIVFTRALRTAEARANQVTRILQHMNTEYHSDEISFTNLIKAHNLVEAFPEKSKIDHIFEAAYRAEANRVHVLQQHAIAEMSHPEGSLSSALRLVREAEREVLLRGGTENLAVLHTKANIYRRMANESPQGSRRSHYRQAAKELLRGQIRNAKTSHAVASYADLLIDELSDALSASGDGSKGSDLAARDIANMVSNIQNVVDDSMYKFPGDEYVMQKEARLYSELGDQRGALAALEGALTTKPWPVFIVMALAKSYVLADRSSDALELLDSALAQQPMRKRLHWSKAWVLMRTDYTGYWRQIGEHLQKCFQRGDRNFERQFWFARHLYIYGSWREGQEIYSDLRRVIGSIKNRYEKRGLICANNGKPAVYEGRVVAVKESFAFVQLNEFAWEVFLHSNGLTDANWGRIRVGQKLRVTIGFNFFGPVVCSVSH